MYAGYKGLAMIKDQDNGCIDGKLPIHEILVMIELGCFSYWILSTPIFLICSKFLGYNSVEEQQVHNGLRKEVSAQESKWRLDFLDYSKPDLQSFNIACVNLLMTISMFIAVPIAVKGGEYFIKGEENSYRHAMSVLVVLNLIVFVNENTKIFAKKPIWLSFTG
jgi:hypothetical protein